MSRMYVVQSWSDAASYSGEQIGDRLSKSQSLFLPNGQANTKLFAETDSKPPKKAKEKRSIADSIDLVNKNYERMERMSDALEKEFEEGIISDPARYEFLRKKMDQRLAKAWERIEKERIAFGYVEESYEDKLSYGEIQLENSLRSSSFLANVMESLSEENIFKKAYKIVKFVMETLK